MQKGVSCTFMQRVKGGGSRYAGVLHCPYGLPLLTSTYSCLIAPPPLMNGPGWQVSDYRNDVILAAACREDVEKHCKDVQPGEPGGRDGSWEGLGGVLQAFDS